jgi:hypothetical protein
MRVTNYTWQLVTSSSIYFYLQSIKFIFKLVDGN